MLGPHTHVHTPNEMVQVFIKVRHTSDLGSDGLQPTVGSNPTPSVCFVVHRQMPETHNGSA